MKKHLKLSSNFILSTVFVLFGVIGAFTGSFAYAQNIPQLTAPVVDEASLISRDQELQINEYLLKVKQQDKVQIQVLLLSDLQGFTIEEFAIKTFDHWKLGDEKKDNGVLLIIAKAERKVRIEVGQGLEGTIPDVIAKRIIREIFSPLAKKDLVSAIRLTVLALENAVSLDQTGEVFNVDRFKEQLIQNQQQNLSQYEQQLAQERLNSQNDQDIDLKKKNQFSLGLIALILFILWIIIFIFSPSTALWILYSLLSSGGRGGGGGYSGGGWSGGGGSSSGGGASGDW